MKSRRPDAVWRGHENSVLSIREWGTDKLITYFIRGIILNVDMDEKARYLYGNLERNI